MVGAAPDTSVLAALKRRWSYEEEVRRILADDLARLAAIRPLRVVDVGCGTTSLLSRFDRHPARRDCRLIGLDVHEPTIAWCGRHGFHDEYVLGDARDVDRLPDVDVIVATDLVEHFDKPDAVALVQRFAVTASLAVLVFTPNGFIFNPFTADNPYMQHRCGFTVDDFADLGYECVGLGGPRFLRKAQSLPRSPKVLTVPLLAVLSRAMRGVPRQSYHLLARRFAGSPRPT